MTLPCRPLPAASEAGAGPTAPRAPARLRVQRLRRPDNIAKMRVFSEEPRGHARKAAAEVDYKLLQSVKTALFVPSVRTIDTSMGVERNITRLREPARRSGPCRPPPAADQAVPGKQLAIAAAGS